MGDGDGWVTCTLGHRHWGRFGAAGLLATDGHVVLLQHRSVRSHEGGTWAVPGGARDSAESTTEAALRETSEETSLDVTLVRPCSGTVDDHGGWSYTTVVGAVTGTPVVEATNFESDELRWVPLDEVGRLPLHPGFAVAWPMLRPHAERLSR